MVILSDIFDGNLLKTFIIPNSQLTFTNKGVVGSQTVNLFQTNTIEITRGLQRLKGDKGDSIKGDKGDDGNDETGKGWSSASYNYSTSVITFVSSDGLGFTTKDLRAGVGATGKGISSITQTGSTLSVNYTDGLNPNSFVVPTVIGATGRGIASIGQSGTTLSVNYTDSLNPDSFIIQTVNITNGTNGIVKIGLVGLVILQQV